MRANVAMLVIVAMLPGCGMRQWFVKPEPYKANCALECFEACAKPIPLPKWESGSADEAVMLLKLDGQIAAMNAAQQDLCETRRAACSACLLRLKQAQVIE